MWHYAVRCCRTLNLRKSMKIIITLLKTQGNENQGNKKKVAKNVKFIRHVPLHAIKRARLAPIRPRVPAESPRNFMLLLTTVFATSMDEHDESPPNSKSIFESENVTPIKTVSELEDMLSEAGEKLVVIFCMVQWCPFCRKIAPTVEDIAAKRARDLVVLQVDMEDQETESTRIVSRYEAYYNHQGRFAVGLPTFVFLRDGVKLEHFSSDDVGRLRTAVRKYMP